jgi:hypothetical protein
MSKPLLAALAVTLTISACGTVRESRFNPFNWFGGSSEQPSGLVPAGGVAALDNRAVAQQITDLSVERAPGGAIVRAAALPPTQGWWDAELIAENDGRAVDGVMTYTFRIAQPPRPWPAGTPQSRELTAGAFIPNTRLEAVRQVVVRGAENQRVARR